MSRVLSLLASGITLSSLLVSGSAFASGGGSHEAQPGDDHGGKRPSHTYYSHEAQPGDDHGGIRRMERERENRGREPQPGDDRRLGREGEVRGQEPEIGDDRGDDRRLAASGIDVRIPLSGAVVNGVRAEGRAEFRSDGVQRQLKVEAQSVNLPNGTAITVRLNNMTTLGVVPLMLGRAELQRNTKDGRFVPVIKPGDSIQVFARIGTAQVLILSGRF